MRLAASSLQSFPGALPARGGFASFALSTPLRHVTAPQAGRGKPGRERAGAGGLGHLPAAAFPDPDLFRFGPNRADALAIGRLSVRIAASDAALRMIASDTLR